MLRTTLTASLLTLAATVTPAFSQDSAEYRVLATSKTSTMQKEMNETANAGYRYVGVMGGETSFGGAEVLVIMSRPPAAKKHYEYRLLATSRSSTLERELQAAGEAGFEYRGQASFQTAFGGKEVVVILERDRDAQVQDRFDYRLLATKRTGTLERELSAAGHAGFRFVGVTIAETAGGPNEVVAILSRKARS